ncbi:hypothetical protein GGX14DRAFT_565852 [Mycena pura]|uniref:Uncharacterized protein n=1 Tax=Mycena pura TaxID=153505 RepID=A0AAD6VHU9_9AGAR|nr:hypothetical protein GGX14DRAFT_565852 [Mycena pura]
MQASAGAQVDVGAHATACAARWGATPRAAGACTLGLDPRGGAAPPPFPTPSAAAALRRARAAACAARPCAVRVRCTTLCCCSAPCALMQACVRALRVDVGAHATACKRAPSQRPLSAHSAPTKCALHALSAHCPRPRALLGAHASLTPHDTVFDGTCIMMRAHAVYAARAVHVKASICARPLSALSAPSSPRPLHALTAPTIRVPRAF